MAQHWTIKDVAKAAGTTSRTLRHYDEIGLLKPSDIGANGYRLYDASALVRLQRILALRDLGLGLAQIRSVLDRDLNEIEALTELERQLVQESARLKRQISTVRRTLASLKKGESPMADTMFDGFKHEDLKEEVEQKWGAESWQQSSSWWNALSKDEQADYQQNVIDLINDWKRAHASGVTPESADAQALAHRQVEWLSATPGPYTWGECTLRQYVVNLGDMYVSDHRFAENFGGEQVAMLVRDALRIYAEAKL